MPIKKRKDFVLKSLTLEYYLLLLKLINEKTTNALNVMKLEDTAHLLIDCDYYA